MEHACPLQLVNKYKPPPPTSDLPVWAQAIRSRRARTIGSANFCTGVGLEYLLRTMLLLMIWPSLQSSNCNIKSGAAFRTPKPGSLFSFTLGLIVLMSHTVFLSRLPVRDASSVSGFPYSPQDLFCV